MDYSIQAEYGSLLEKNSSISMQLKELPVGYISQKTIKGTPRYYLQHRDGDKLVGTYIHSTDVENVRLALEHRSDCEEEKKQIESRLDTLEQAAELIGKGLTCRLMVMKLSAGMDELLPEERKKCSSFAAAMNAVEGVAVSPETSEEIKQWQAGDKTFRTVFENTLLRYGFTQEGI